MNEHARGETPEPARLATPGEDAAWKALGERVTIALRPIGAPTTLGLFGLAAATLLVSGLQLGWVEVSETPKVAVVLIAFAFLAQATAAIFAFLARDGVEASAMGALALTWLVIGLVLLTSQPGQVSDALGLFLIFSAVALGLCALTAASSKLVVALIFAVAATRFLVTALYELTGENGWQDAAGVIGVALFGLAMYGAWAALLEDAQGKTVLPLGRRGTGKVAIEGGLLEQVRQAPNEPGVRTEL